MSQYLHPKDWIPVDIDVDSLLDEYKDNPRVPYLEDMRYGGYIVQVCDARNVWVVYGDMKHARIPKNLLSPRNEPVFITNSKGGSEWI